jgi:hypothetical protein
MILGIASAETPGTNAALPVFHRGVPIPIVVALANTGSVPWYGYDTGLYYGQTRVRVRYFTHAGAFAFEDGLFIEGSPKSHDHGRAIGALSAPDLPAHYRAVFDIDVFQDARIGSRHVGARTLDVTVVP